MKKVTFLTVAAIMLLAASCGQKVTIGGTYSFGNDVTKEPVGSVMVYPIDDNSVFFYLEVCMGPPAYNSGSMLGKMTIKDNVGIYDSKIDNEFLTCVLKFEFSADQLKITTDETDDYCGFGHGVSADHTYKLTDKSIPQGYETMEGDFIKFEDLK